MKIDKCLPEKSESFDKYFQEFKDIAIKMCSVPPDRNIDNATLLSEFSDFLKSEIDNNAIIDIELKTDSETGWIDYQAKEIYLNNSQKKDFYKKFIRYLKDRGEHLKLSKRVFLRDILKANEIVELHCTSQKTNVERYDYERRIGGHPYRILVLDCDSLKMKQKISTLNLRVLIFTLYTYKYHKIYMVYSYTIIKGRKKPQT